MPLQFKKISDAGTENPIIARLGVQTGEILKWTRLEKAQSDRVGELYVFNLSQRLVRCERSMEAIKNKLEEDIERVNVITQKDPRAAHVPYVTDLEGHVESFLYEAKNFLRDLISIFQIAYECDLDSASAFADNKSEGTSAIAKWAQDKFGDDDRLAKILRADVPWLTELVRKRNASEHPGGHSGTLQVDNVAVDVKNNVLVPPTWNRTDEPQSQIISDMINYVESLLTFAEDLLLDLFFRTGRTDIVTVYEMPPEKRDPACPIRFQVNLNPEMMDKLNRAKG